MPDDANRAPYLAIIDDEAAFCRLVERIAKDCGYKVFATTDPMDFRQKIAGIDPALIILDLQIPGMDGIELLRELSGLELSGHVLLISGSDTKVMESAMFLGQARGMRMEGFLQKPLRAEELRKILDRRHPTIMSPSKEDLLQAIEQNGLALHYQAKLDLRNDQIVGVEALARWRHPTLGSVPPTTFIPLAERTEIITPLTRWVIAEAIAQAGDWRAQGLDMSTSINLSAAATYGYDLPDWIETICQRAKLPTDKVTFELTETAAMQDSVRLLDVLTRLRLKGFHLSIDDFGIGYSSLVQLQKLPFSELKIDIHFIQTLLTAESSNIIVDTIIGMARNLKLKTVAEGVESPKVLAALKQKGCDYAQGFYMAHPLSSTDFLDMLPSFKLPV
ncbi:MAG TPA: EAL domain-containing response regulator [Terriglobales bacterium]|nr:EAL domain-containing response regulator [Terriglobales bacterium]